MASTQPTDFLFSTNTPFVLATLPPQPQEEQFVPVVVDLIAKISTHITRHKLVLNTVDLLDMVMCMDLTETIRMVWLAKAFRDLC